MKNLSRYVLAALLATPLALHAEKIDGKFLANGKPHALTYGTVVKGTVEGRDGPIDAHKVVLCEKAPAAGKTVTEDLVKERALGSCIMSSFDAKSQKKLHDFITSPDLSGSISYGSGGTLTAEDVKLDNGVLSGRLHEKGDMMDEKYEIDVSFKLPVK